MRLIAVIALFFAALGTATADITDQVNAALEAESRPSADRARDANRRPAQTLEFFRLEDDMRVLELFPGGGWYTRVLAPVLADEGQLYVALGTSRVADTVLQEPAFGAVELLETSANPHYDSDVGGYVIEPFEFGVDDLDMVLTFRNLHSYGADYRAMINRQVFASLRSGGYYGVIDHTRRHMEADSRENRRRMDPVVVIKEMLDAGFEWVDYSTLHFRADDELRYEVGRRSVAGNTDRFTLLFRKP